MKKAVMVAYALLFSYREEEEFPEEKPTMFTGFEAAPDAETLLQEPKKKTAKFKKRKRKKT